MRFEKAKELFEKYDIEWKEKCHHVYAHSIRVMDYAMKVCEELGIEKDYRKDIESAAKYHDIGKIKYPKKMREPNRKFTKKEIKIFKNHVKYGYDIMKAFYGNDSIAKLILYHHEKLDGSGYPKGLKEEKIPLGSRIITVCDAYDAMSRHYNHKTKEQAIQELKDSRGIHFDGDIVDAFLKIIGKEKENENRK